MAHRKPWRFARIFALLAALLMAFALALVFVYRYSAERQLGHTLANHLGLPRTTAEVMERYAAAIRVPETPPPARAEGEQDAAAAVIEGCMAVEAFSGQPQPQEWMMEQAWKSFSLSDEQRAQLNALRVQHRQVVDRLLRMSKGTCTRLSLGNLDAPRAFYWTCGSNSDLLWVLLGAEAESCGRAGDYPRMVLAFRALATIEEVLGQTPAVTARWAACRGIHEAKAAAFAYILDRVRLSNSVLDEIDSCFQYSLHEDVLREALLLYRDLGQLYVGHPRRYYEKFRPSPSLLGAVLAGGAAISGFAANDQNRFLNQMDELIAIANASLSERIARIHNFEAGLSASWDEPMNNMRLSNGFLMPALCAVEDSYCAQRTSETVRAALAIERFRNDTGELPASLDALTPQYLATVPIDVFTGRRLCYTHGERGYMVHSVALDGDDEGEAHQGVRFDSIMFPPAGLVKTKARATDSS